jgi:hypothetical protein
MIQQAINRDGPGHLLRAKRRYWDKTDVDLVGGLAAALPMNSARTLSAGPT